jgi:hypothetical protein
LKILEKRARKTEEKMEEKKVYGKDEMVLKILMRNVRNYTTY